jgi:hypothetical protein
MATGSSTDSMALSLRLFGSVWTTPMHCMSTIAVCIDFVDAIDDVLIVSGMLNTLSNRATSLLVDGMREQLVGDYRSSG